MQINNLLVYVTIIAVETKWSRLLKARTWLLKFCLCVGVMGLASQILATETTTKTTTPSITKIDTDWSKVLPVTPMPRPGLFGIGPSGPSCYSVWDMFTGKKREKPPVSPYGRFALLPTSAFDIDFSYLEKPDHEKDVFDPVKRIHMGSDWLLSFGVVSWYRHVRETDSRLNASGTQVLATVSI